MNQKFLLKGTLFAIGACFVWGLIFVVPYFMNDFTTLEVVIGRYLFYGSLSTLLFLKAKFHKLFCYARFVWIKAILFSLVSTIGYYIFLVLGLRYSSPAISALILGISPITIAFYGNWKEKETSFKSLLIPSLLILVGLITINAPEFILTPSPTKYSLGLLFTFIALLAWTWYVVVNSKFLKNHPNILSSDWATLIGAGSLFWTFLFILALAPFFETPHSLQKYLSFNFLIGSAVSGILSSWVGAFLWNRASFYLPVSLAGQLTLFETIFGVIFYYTLIQTLPSFIECVGITILLSSIIYGIRKFAKNTSFTEQITPH
jgi:drug/metabolite transporter (DMT)-like permease